MSEREKLIKKNKEIISIPVPDFENMTNEELRKRYESLDSLFKELWKDEKA